jgi:hypothetical protein
MIRLCSDCKFYRPRTDIADYPGRFAKCAYPEIKDRAQLLVAGHAPPTRDCQSERSWTGILFSRDHCGAKGRWWMPK